MVMMMMPMVTDVKFQSIQLKNKQKSIFFLKYISNNLFESNQIIQKYSQALLVIQLMLMEWVLVKMGFPGGTVVAPKQVEHMQVDTYQLVRIFIK